MIETEFGGGHALGFGYVGKVFTLGDVDSDFTALDAVFFILSAFILGVLLDSKFLHGGIEKLGETFGVEAVAVDLNSLCHSYGHGRNRRWWCGLDDRASNVFIRLRGDVNPRINGVT